MDRIKANINASTSGYKIDLVQWTALKLPFKDSCVDIIVTAMPLSESSETESYNEIFYEQCLWEFARVVKFEGQLVLLFYDRYNYINAVIKTALLFNIVKQIYVNIGGIQAAVIVLERTITTIDSIKRKRALVAKLSERKKDLYTHSIDKSLTN